MILDNFIVGRHYSNQYIKETLRCTPQAYLRVRGGEIVAACLRLDENPDGVTEIWVGEGPGRRRLASDFLRQCEQNPSNAIPLFLKTGNSQPINPNVWEYQGCFKAIGEEESYLEISKRHRPKDPVVRVIYLERVSP